MAISPHPTPAAILIDPATLEALPWHDLPGFDHVTYKLLWQSGRSVSGIMRIPPGAEVSSHAHQHAHHHVWVLDGSAMMLGSRFGPGSYLHIPATVEHSITDPGPTGCTILYLYLRDDTSG
jgi:mannose-6-phosphate isomerase-like protein (cupin superfamily)